MVPGNIKEYLAFISYQRDDENFAEWLQHQLEHYRIPINVLEAQPELNDCRCKIFLDKTELSGGILSDEIDKALMASHFLIVLCSPSSAKSKWVDKEIRRFLSLNGRTSVIPLIISGTPYAQNPEEECFVPTLRELRNTSDEILGINVSEMGREVASIKAIAFMLGLKFDTLWQRYERDKEVEQQRLIDERNKLLRLQSMFLSEKSAAELSAGNLSVARLLALKALPSDIDNPDRPLVKEADNALRKAMSTMSHTLRENGPLRAIAIDSANDRIIIGGDNRCIKWWGLSDGQVLHSVEKMSRINSIRLSSDASMFVVSTYKGHVIVFDANGVELKRFKNQPGPIYDAVLSHDMSILIVASANGLIYKYDFITSELLSKVDAHKIRSIKSVDISRDDRFIISSSSDGYVKIWNSSSMTLINLLNFKDEALTSSRFSPDGKHILITSNSGTVRLLNLETNEIIWAEDISEVCIRCGSFSKDGTLIALGESYGVMRIVNAATGRTEKIFEVHTEAINAIEFGKDDSIVVTASSDNSVHIQEIKSNMEDFQSEILDIHSIDISMHPFESIIAAITQHGHLTTYNYDTDKKLVLPTNNRRIVATVFSNISGILTGVLTDRDTKGNRYVITWDSATGEITNIFNCHTVKDSNIRYSFYDEDMNIDEPYKPETIPDMTIRYSFDDRLLAISDDKKIELFNPVNGKMLRTIDGIKGGIKCFDFSPIDNNIAIGGNSGIFHVIDAVSERILYTRNFKPERVVCVAYSRNGCRIAIALSSKSTIIYDSALDKMTTKINSEWPIKAITFMHNDCNLIVATTQGIEIHDISSETSADKQAMNKYQNIDTLITKDEYIYFSSKSHTVGRIYFPLKKTLRELIDDARRALGAFELTEEQRHKFYLDV